MKGLQGVSLAMVAALAASIIASTPALAVNPNNRLGDFVWEDRNGNGIQDPGEPGIPGVTVNVRRCFGDQLQGTAVTNASGYYEILNLFPVQIYVEFILPAGYTFSPADQGGDDTKDSDANTATGRTECFRMPEVGEDLTRDAGLVLTVQPASLGDRVWNDVNRNGVQDGGELGVPGVTVHLFTCDGAPVGMTTTDDNGTYGFSGLMPGDYYVAFVAPAGYVFTLLNQGGNPANDSDADPVTGQTICTTLVSGENDPTWDAGIYIPDQPAQLGDRVWKDANTNGVQDDGEVGIPGVTVNLFKCDGTLAGSTTTDSDGNYSFSGLTPGSYYVMVVAPAGYVFSPKKQGGDPAKDSDADPDTGMMDCTTLTSGENDPTWDAGLYRKPTSPGTGTPGYWRNHPQAWPVDSITIGGVTYTKAQAIAIIRMPDGDKTYTMFRALVSAKLNVIIGNESSCIDATIADADAWMAAYGPAGSGVRANSAAWRMGEPLYTALDAYNNGLMCAPHRN